MRSERMDSVTLFSQAVRRNDPNREGIRARILSHANQEVVHSAVEAPSVRDTLNPILDSSNTRE